MADESSEYAPTDGVTYNPNEAKYWDKDALNKELVRSFDLCQGCRLCFKFCQSFPTLFDAVDETGDVREISAEITDKVVDQCFQCKLCYTQCPYTEVEQHDFKLDFPRLMLRANAVRRRETGVPLREKMLGDPDKLGKLACRTAGMANAANRFRPHRILMEKMMGIHRDKLLPEFASTTFEAWADRQESRNASTADDRPVLLFATCFVNYNRPEVGQAAHRVLRHNDCQVTARN